jgi:hypothetical protein
VKGDGVVPLLTVRPETGWSAVMSETGYAGSQVPMAAWEGVASAAVPARQSPAVTTAETASRARGTDDFMYFPL